MTIMRNIEYLKTRKSLIQGIPVKEIKYAGSATEEVNAYIAVYPRVIIYESESEDDATYIFLTKEKMECFLAITLAEYFTSDIVRKRADFDNNMNMHSYLFKRITLKGSSEEDWTEAIDFYTNKRMQDVLGEEEGYCFSKATKENGLNISDKERRDFLFDKLPFVGIQKNGVGWNEPCFPAFTNDTRYNEAESNMSGFRAWYNEEANKEDYRRFTRFSAEIKLCSYGNKYTQSDILMFRKILAGY